MRFYGHILLRNAVHAHARCTLQLCCKLYACRPHLTYAAVKCDKPWLPDTEFDYWRVPSFSQRHVALTYHLWLLVPFSGSSGSHILHSNSVLAPCNVLLRGHVKSAAPLRPSATRCSSLFRQARASDRQAGAACSLLSVCRCASRR